MNIWIFIFSAIFPKLLSLSEVFEIPSLFFWLFFFSPISSGVFVSPSLLFISAFSSKEVFEMSSFLLSVELLEILFIKSSVELIFFKSYVILSDSYLLDILIQELVFSS